MGNSVMLNGVEYAGEQIAYKDSTYELVSKVAYLIGVPLRIFQNEHEPPKIEIYDRLEQDKNARIIRNCALPGFVDSKNEEKTERNAGYLVVSHSGGGMLRQGTRKGIRRTPANRGMRAHRIVKSLDISEDVCHGLCP